MKYKKGLIFICLLICLFSIASVVASDVNETVVANEDQNDEIISVENEEIVSTNDVDEVGTIEEDELSATTGTFTDLANEIANVGDELNLTRDYKYSTSDSRYKDGITINKKIIVNGNGYVINGNNQARGFYVSYKNVLLKNITFVNCSSSSYSGGGAVYWSGSDGVLANCSFVNCSSSIFSGGAVYWSGSDGVLANCSFVKCSGSSFGGGAVYWSGSDGVLANCSFVNCSGSRSGGAVYWYGSNGILANCSFVNCSSSGSGGAVYWYGSNGILANCSFVNCSSSGSGGAVCWGDKLNERWVVNGSLVNCSFVNCSTCYSSSSGPSNGEYNRGSGGAVYWYGSNGILANCSFVNCSSVSPSSYSPDFGGGAVYWNTNGILANCSFVNCSSRFVASAFDQGGGAVYLNRPNSILANCSFVNCSSKYGGAVSWYGSNGILSNCSFVNCSSPVSGGAVYWDGSNGILANCSFVNCSSSSSDVAVSWEGDNGFLVNCSFVNCSCSGSNYICGGAVYWDGSNGILANCSFVNCSSKYGGAVYWYGSNGILANCSFVNCSSSSFGGAVYWYGSNGILANCSFVNCSSSKSGGAVYWTGSNGILSNCSFVNCSCSGSNHIYGGAVYWSGSNGILSNCSFVNCSCSGPNYIYGGAVYWSGSNGILSNCSFVNCSSKYGGAVYWSGDNGTNIDCNSKSSVYWPGSNGILVDCNYTIVSGNCKILHKSFINVDISKSSNFGDLLPLNYVINENATGEIYIYVNNVLLDKINVNEEYNLYGLNAGNNSVKVVYSGDDYYVGCEDCINIFVSKINTTISVSPVKLVWDNTTIDIILNYKATGNIILNINNKNYSCNVDQGKTTFHIYDLDIKEYSYIIEYSGDKNFNQNNVEGKLIIEKKESKMDLKCDNINVNDELNVYYNITKGVTGNLNIYSDNILIKTVAVGKDIEISNLKAGNHTLKVVYSGDDYYASCEQITTFNVEKYDPYFYFDNDLPGKNVAIDLVFDEDATGYVNITFDEFTFYNQKLVNGKTSFVIPDLVAGWHDYVVNYTGDEKYKSVSEIDETYIWHNDAPITLNIPELNWGDLFIINPILPKGATGDIEVLFDHVSLCNMSVGKNYRYNLLNGGKHYLTVWYSGDGYFGENETTFELNIKRFDSTLSINDTVYANPSSLIEVKLNEEINGFITVTINNKKYSGYVVNGTFTFNVNNFNIGSNNAIINFTGDSKYNPIYTVKEINVLLKDAKLDLSISNVIQGNDLTIKPTVVSGATGTFKIYVDEELKATKSIGSSYTLSKPAIGKHEIKIIYSGDSYFAQSELNEAFRVFKIYPIEAIDTQIVYGSEKHFRAKFYDENGLALKNKYVQFSVANKDYPVLTDNEGIAVLNVDLPIGKYNITSVSLLDESKTNKLLIFNSVQAENMVLEYSSGEKFKATFLDETAKPLSNTGVIFIVDGVTQPMVRTDVNGLAVFNQMLNLGTHTITSINTITGQNITNKVIVVSDINAIMNVNDIKDINYKQAAALKINVGSAYLDGNVEIIITGDNGYKQTFTQKASTQITRQLTGLNAGKYTVNVVYHGSEDVLVINSNKTFNVLKIDPTVELILSDYYTNSRATITVNVDGSNGTVTLKVGSRTYYEKLTNGELVKNINGLAVGDYNVEALFDGDINYNPMIKTSSFKMYHNIDFKVNFPSSLVLYDDDKSNVDISQTVYMENMMDEDNDVLTLKIDGKLIEFSISGWTDEDGNDMGYSIEFGYGFLKEGEHTWEIKLSNEVNNLIGSKSGTFNVYRWSNFYDIFNFGLIDDPTVNSILVKDINKNVKIGTYQEDGYQYNYYVSTFVYNGVKYSIIDGLGHAVMHNPIYIEFNPNDYALYDNSFYKIENGIIVDIISNYEILDGVYYRLLGCGEYTSSLDNSTLPFYFLMEYDGVCYKYLGGYKEAIKNVDYKIVDGKYYYMDGSEVGVLEGDDFAIINGYRYYIEDNYYNTQWPPHDDLILINGNFYHAIGGEYDESTGEYKKHYVIDNGKLFIVENGAIGSQIKLKQPVSDKDISIPALPSSSGESVSVKLPSDASGTITLSINDKEYNFTVADGVANVKVPELANGGYPYTITYSGDDKYSSFSKTGSLTVNNPSKTTPTNPATPTKPVTKTTLTLKKVTIKRSAKKLTIQATLKVNGKGVKNKIIKFKFNKKTYKARTNAKGVAKIKIAKKVLKKLKKGKKVTYTATYGKITKKVTVKVKK